MQQRFKGLNSNNTSIDTIASIMKKHMKIANVNAYYSLLYLQEDVHQALCWTPFLCQLLMKAGVALVLPIPILMQGPHHRNENLCSSFGWTGFCVQPWKQAFWLPWSVFWLIVLQCHWYAARKQIKKHHDYCHRESIEVNKLVS